MKKISTEESTCNPASALRCGCKGVCNLIIHPIWEMSICGLNSRDTLFSDRVEAKPSSRDSAVEVVAAYGVCVASNGSERNAMIKEQYK